VVAQAAVLVEAPVVVRAQAPAVPERAPVAEPPGVLRAAQQVARAGLPDPAHRPGRGAAPDRVPAGAGLNTRGAVARGLRARAE